MGTFSIWHWLIVLVVVVVLFGGRGKLSSIMGDAARGIKAFQRGLKEGDDPKPEDERAARLPRTEAEKEDLRR
jgi:sec-independent protein translocase protein TatA